MPVSAARSFRNTRAPACLAIVYVCFPLAWTHKLLLHWLAAVVTLAIMVYVLFETVLH